MKENHNKFASKYQKAEVNEKSILDILFIKSIYIFYVLIIEVFDEFKILLREDYKHDL